MQDAGTGEAHYRAFVSYSHRDQAFGRRLHRRLERYAVPRRLVGRLTPRGPTPKRVAPVFRDREELSAAHDLSAEIREALASSGALIVVCTPNAAASPWVAREIELFRELHPDRPVLAALAAGEPVQAFPRSLTVAGGAPVEPLAADFRREGDGARLALLKLVAGVLGVRLDELVQRDAQRRLRGVMAVTGAAVAGAVAMSGLTTYALVARAEAQRQRAEAEALVEFMLTDLRDRLKGVGRLDVLTAVNERTLAYYRDQPLEDLPAESLVRRARILHAMGEDDVERGDLPRARAEFEAAESITGALLREAPDDAERLWAHAQSRYWTGLAAFRAGDRPAAGTAWQDYRRLAGRLASRHAENPQYLREVAYAEGNLCTLALMRPRQPAVAEKACGEALRWMQLAATHRGAPADISRDLANRRAWMSQAYAASGDFPQALEERRAEQAILQGLLQEQPRAMDLKSQWVAMQQSFAAIELELGRPGRARPHVEAAAETINSMIAFEPQNERWRRLRARVNETRARMIVAEQREGGGL